MIENILIVDCETTGLDPNKGSEVIELCGVLYSIEHKSVLSVISGLYPCDENAAQHINGIDPEITKTTPGLIRSFYLYFMDLLPFADAAVAHNASFDKRFIKLPDELPWICTQHDFPWPVPLKRRRLQDICESLEIPYVDAHRAYTDCMLLVQCFNRVEELGKDLAERFNSIGEKE